jgi:hypothetical protein
MTIPVEDAEQTARRNEDSAVTVARLVLGSADVLRPAHVTELLSVAIWMFTEARGKYQTRYTTPAALEPRAEGRHEHVIPRKTIRHALLQHPDRVEHIMRLATACIVTREEHQLLNGTHFGWSRYKEAGLTVIDRATGSRVDLGALAAALDASWEQALTDS